MQQTVVALDEPIAGMPAPADRFDSHQWLRYFQRNRVMRDKTEPAKHITLDANLTAPLIRSLQRFQVGETGDGTHLKRFAAATRNAQYIECINLFVAEEQEHARLLARALSCLGGTLLSWHWSDAAFTTLRRACGLKTAILTLFVAEVIGKCFYDLVSRRCADVALAVMFAQIVRDEVGHLRFHTEYARFTFRKLPGFVRFFIACAWFTLFTCGCIVFVTDHRRALYALGSSPLSFLRNATNVFLSSATRVLG